jgi:hypothetical protein
MTRNALVVAALSLAPTAVADADPEPQPPATETAPAPAAAKDLRIDALPAKKTMAMRPKQAPKGDATPGTTAAGADAGGTTPGNTDTSTSAHFDRIPTTWADLRDRVIFRLNAGYEIDSAPSSGETLRGGAPLPPGFNNNRSWISGDAVVGIHDIVLPSLGGYFLTAYQLSADTVSGASSVQSASRSDLVVPGDADGQRAVIKAGYLDYQTDDKDGDHLWLRAGRQFRLDGGAMFAYYDGATVGFNSGNGLSLSAFAGQRVQLYLDPNTSPTTGETLPSQCVNQGVAQAGTNCIMNPGIMFGGTLGLDLKKMSGVPVKIGVDYEGLDIDTANGSGDTPINTNEVKQVRSLVAASANIDLSRNSHLDLRARFVDDGSTGFGFGRAGAHLRMALTKDLMLVADVDQRGPDDYAYDLAAASQVDVVDISRRLGVGLAPPIDSTLVGAQLDYRKGNKEALVFARANIAEDTVHFVDQQGWEEVGVGLAGAPLPSTWITGQYSFRHYELNDAAGINEVTTMGTIAFDDLSGSGLTDMHEFSLEGWWRSHRQGNGQLRIGGGFFYRIYDMVTPYEQTSNDGRAGGRLDLAYWITRDLHIIGNGELAQPSPTLMREIGTMSSGRIALELRF